MILIKTSDDNGPEVDIHRIRFQGTTFYQIDKDELIALPIGHFWRYRFTYFLSSNQFQCQSDLEWLIKPKATSLRKNLQSEFPIKKIGHSEAKEIVILNCLDTCYGHVFYKLLNASYHHQNNQKVIPIIPTSFKWLVPGYVEEYWVVDSPLSGLETYLINLEKHILSNAQRFSKIWLSHAYPHPDYHQLNLNDFIKFDRFDLNTYHHNDHYQVTFMYREDRFWFRSKVQELVYLGLKKYGMLRLFRGFFIEQQLRHFEKIAQILSNSEEFRFNLVGLCQKRYKLSDRICDHRTLVHDMTEEVENSWCQLYAKSHVIIGVHGSHMMIPSALAAGFVSVVPNYKIANLAQDILSPYSDRLLYFMGRFLYGQSSARLIAQQVLTQVRGFSVFYENLMESSNEVKI